MQPQISAPRCRITWTSTRVRGKCHIPWVEFGPHSFRSSKALLVKWVLLCQPPSMSSMDRCGYLTTQGQCPKEGVPSEEEGCDIACPRLRSVSVPALVFQWHVLMGGGHGVRRSVDTVTHVRRGLGAAERSALRIDSRHHLLKY